MNWHQACELPYYHGSDLGANPTAEETTFKLWAPTACGVVVCLYATGTDAEPGAKELGVHEMRRGDGGVWAIVLSGNLHGTYYIYRIYFPDGRVHEVVDPYARSAGANGTRGMVVDLTQAAPDGWEQDRRPEIPAHARSAGANGTRGMVVMDDSTCMVNIARFFLDFTARESCGKCVPCRIGTTRMMEILNRICEGEGQEGDIELLEELCVSIKDGALCGLGQTAPNPVLTTIRYFREEYEAHIRDKKCPAHECSALLTISIDPAKCTGCTVCARKCPVECISGTRKEPHVIDQSACIKCKQCVSSCKFGAIVVD